MIITLCGSTKFKKDFILWNLFFTLCGHIVLSCSVFGHSKKIKFERKDKAILDVIHFKKIDLSDMIFVIDSENYIGESTEREIEYASINKKTVIYASIFFDEMKTSQKHGQNYMFHEHEIDIIKRILKYFKEKT